MTAVLDTVKLLLLLHLSSIELLFLFHLHPRVSLRSREAVSDEK
jgi:hypothetical protein